MFARLTAFLPVVLAATFVGASIVPRSDYGSAGECSTGPVQCCDSTYDTKHHSSDLLASLLNLDIGDITGLLAVQCSPLNIIGAGGVQCDATPVCCSNQANGGLVSIGCAPVVL